MVGSENAGGSSDWYKLPEGATDLQDLIEHNNMNAAVSNIFKGSWRLGMKAGTTVEYDLNKIIWYANRELRRLEKLKWERENKAKPTTTDTTELRRLRSSEQHEIKPEQTR